MILFMQCPVDKRNWKKLRDIKNLWNWSDVLFEMYLLDGVFQFFRFLTDNF